MILSRHHKFLFVKGKKVAGTSIEIALSQVAGPEDIVTPISPIDERLRLQLGGRPQNYSADAHLEEIYLDWVVSAEGDDTYLAGNPAFRLHYNHMPLREVLAKHPEAATYLTFCVERSPYSKLISWAHWRLQRIASPGQHTRPSLTQITSFLSSAAEEGTIRTVRNIDLYRGRSGAVEIRALRYEALEPDFTRLMQDLGVASPPSLPHAKPGLMSDTLDPRTIFTRAQLDEINKVFAEEFSVFGREPI